MPKTKRPQAPARNPDPSTIRSLSKKEGTDLLNNFAATPITIDGIVYPTAEHAFQAAKTTDRATKERIAALPTPGKAKHAGGKRAPIERRITPIPGWDDKRIAILHAILTAKFEQNADAAAQLQATGDRPIEEGNAHNDTFYGISFRTHRGHNHLGRILQQIRAARRA